MATQTVQNTSAPVSAQHGIHDAIRLDTDGPPAVIFNSGAGLEDVLSYAHGQLRILDGVLSALSQRDEGQPTALSYALRAILDPAVQAISLAADRVRATAKG